MSDIDPLTMRSGLALLLYDRAYFRRPGEDDKSTIPLHAGLDDCRFSLRWTVLARIGLKPQIELPERKGSAGPQGHEVRIAAVTNSRYLLFESRVLEIELCPARHAALTGMRIPGPGGCDRASTMAISGDSCGQAVSSDPKPESPQLR